MIYLNDQPIVPTIFPDKTSQIWKIPEFYQRFVDMHKFDLQQCIVEVRWKFDLESEIMHLAQLKMLLDSNGLRAILKLDYLPYARQDKYVDNYSTFALYTFAKILNDLKFEFITILDPHSETALNIIKNSVAHYPILMLQKVIADTKSDILCYPDKGALSKYSNIYADLNLPYIYGEKVRDQLTGNITSYKVIGDSNGKNVLIVDDICDGGMTFKLLAKDLLAAGANEVSLFVTHGLFSKGLGTLKESGIKHVFTKDGEVSECENKIIYRRI